MVHHIHQIVITLQVFKSNCPDIGVPISHEKTVEHIHVLIALSVHNMTMQLLTEKLYQLNSKRFISSKQKKCLNGKCSHPLGY